MDSAGRDTLPWALTHIIVFACLAAVQRYEESVI